MKIFASFVILLAVNQVSTEETTETVTFPISERVALLKYQLAKEIEKKQNQDKTPKYNDDVANIENLEYVDIENQPVTPISQNDERKKHGRFRLKQLKTTTETLWTRPKSTTIGTKTKPIERQKSTEIVADDITSSSGENKPKLLGIDHFLNLPRNQSLRSVKPLTNHRIPLPRNIFYRRIFDGDVLEKRCTKANIHCVDLLTPILTGQKLNITQKKIMNYKDPDVIRLLQLLSEDMRGIKVEDVYTLLYQISNVQIRLFQWDVLSLKMLFNVICKGSESKRHSWHCLRVGLKRLIKGWHMDITQVDKLLSETKIFRPPCIANHNSGSTQSSKVVRYTKKSTPKCPEGISGSCES